MAVNLLRGPLNEAIRISKWHCRFNRFANDNLRCFSLLSKNLGQNLTEKIVQRHVVNLPKDHQVRSGEFVTIRPYKCMSHDNSWPIAQKFLNIGANSVKTPSQIVITLDHDVQNISEANLRKYKNIENFAELHGIDFYHAGRGIGHQIMIEEGYALPGTMSVASDSHSNMYGGVGCLGTPVVRTDAASIWATGETWWFVPPVAQVVLIGDLAKGVTGKDVIVALCGLFSKDEVLNHAVEFTGPGISSLSIDQRLTIANMTTEWGAATGLFPIDSRLVKWYEERAEKASGFRRHRINLDLLNQLKTDPVQADKDAKYVKRLSLDLSSLNPVVSGPNSVKSMHLAYDLHKRDIKIDKAYLVSCTNARSSDLNEAAEVLKGKKVAEGVQFYFCAASKNIEDDAQTNGTWQTLLDAGGIALPSGCGPCIGLGTGLLQKGETGISASNRNFKGRMGDKEALAYLASPEIVASSAVAGKITSSHLRQPKDTVFSIESLNTDDEPTETSEMPIVKGFPEKVEGEILFCDTDNLNTDGIYPGKYTYRDDLTREKMAQVCMENYDPAFKDKVKEGNVLVSGLNFGTGSSREQAATALLAQGIRLVVAGSFSSTFKRNAINNALLCLESPLLVEKLRSYYGNRKKDSTNQTQWHLSWNIKKRMLQVTQPDGTSWQQLTNAIAPSVQEIIAKGGLESWVKCKVRDDSKMTT